MSTLVKHRLCSACWMRGSTPAWLATSWGSPSALLTYRKMLSTHCSSKLWLMKSLFHLFIFILLFLKIFARLYPVSYFYGTYIYNLFVFFLCLYELHFKLFGLSLYVYYPRTIHSWTIHIWTISFCTIHSCTIHFWIDHFWTIKSWTIHFFSKQFTPG